MMSPLKTMTSHINQFVLHNDKSDSHLALFQIWIKCNHCRLDLLMEKS